MKFQVKTAVQQAPPLFAMFAVPARVVTEVNESNNNNNNKQQEQQFFLFPSLNLLEQLPQWLP